MVLKKDLNDNDAEILDAGLESLAKFLQKKREGHGKKEEAARRIRQARIRTYQRMQRSA